MRISDWSSYVCSSDLRTGRRRKRGIGPAVEGGVEGQDARQRTTQFVDRHVDGRDGRRRGPAGHFQTVGIGPQGSKRTGRGTTGKLTLARHGASGSACPKMGGVEWSGEAACRRRGCEGGRSWGGAG